MKAGVDILVPQTMYWGFNWFTEMYKKCCRFPPSFKPNRYRPQIQQVYVEHLDQYHLGENIATNLAQHCPVSIFFTRVCLNIIHTDVT